MPPLADTSNRPHQPPSTPTRLNPKSPPRLGHKVAALAAANRLRDASSTSSSSTSNNNSPARVSFGGAGGGGGQPVPKLVVESQRYEEWMKIATDNKITSTNTWSLALIDYFADMSLLRNGDGDNSINFQKASCTLDGCVKIWTSRVDSVATETGKLLSGLAEDGRATGNEEDDEDGDDDEDDEAREARKAKKKTARRAETLADSFSKIRVKSFDLEFTVDPLFKKTSADFDEGGAGGILMNHLGCDGNMKVVFDAGDAKLDNNEDDGDGEEEEEDDQVEVDLIKLRARFLPDGLTPIAQMSLCPSLSSFRFSPDANLDLGILNPVDDDDDHSTVNGGGGDDFLEGFGTFDKNAGAGNDDFFGGGGGDGFGDDEGGDDFGGDGGGEDFFAVERAEAEISFANANASGGGGVGGGGEPGEYRVGGGGELVASLDGVGGEGMFDVFDQVANGKNWAGPEHWKMRRVAVRKDETTSSATAKQRKEKITFSFDFTLPPPITQKELFATAPTPSSIRSSRKSSLGGGGGSTTTKGGRRSSKPKGEVEEEDYTLPVDCGFNSQVLLRLFLKPKTILKMRRRSPIMLDGNGSVEHDVEYWAQQQQQDGGEEMGGGMQPEDYPEDQSFGGYAVPFDTQLLNLAEDDDDLPYFNEDELDDTSPAGASASLDQGEDDLLQSATQLKRVRPENINYAKRAKRVDVKKLKDSIWKELEEVTIAVKEFPKELSYTPSSPSLPTTIAPESLIPVVTGLRRQYPADKMEEISTSFCFICLLHLANEKGLRIQTPAGELEEGEEEGMEMRRLVGGLEGLRVFREVEE